MGDSSFTSILILLVLFIILPSVLKFIGQYTLGSKNAPREKPLQETDEKVQDQAETMEDYHLKDLSDFHDRQQVDNRPITPKWF